MVGVATPIADYGNVQNLRRQMAMDAIRICEKLCANAYSCEKNFYAGDLQIGTQQRGTPTKSYKIMLLCGTECR